MRRHASLLVAASLATASSALRVACPSAFASATIAQRSRCLRMEDAPFSVDDAVRVKPSLVFFHVPGNKAGFDAQGLVGIVQRVYTEPDLDRMGGNVKVKFDEPKPWTAHFDDMELELASAAAPDDEVASEPGEDEESICEVAPGGNSVAESMTLLEDAVVLAPEMALREAAELLTQNRITGAPVVEGGRLVGVLTQFDFLYVEAGSTALTLGSERWRSAVQKSLAGDVRAAMTPDPVSVAPDAEMSEVAALMVRKRFNHVPVVCSDGSVVGILSSPDVLRHVLSQLNDA